MSRMGPMTRMKAALSIARSLQVVTAVTVAARGCTHAQTHPAHDSHHYREHRTRARAHLVIKQRQFAEIATPGDTCAHLVFNAGFGTFQLTILHDVEAVHLHDRAPR